MQSDIRQVMHQQRQLTRRVFGKKECLHPKAPHDCNGNIVKAHTVQRNGVLLLVAENGHVLTLGMDPDRANGRLVVAEKVGIRKASTFTGFCSTHDKQLFAPIEDNPLQLTRRHAFLLAYRCMSRERFGKARLAELGPESVDAGTIPEDEVQSIQEGATLAEQDLFVFGQMQEALNRNNYSRTRFYAIEFDSISEVLCSGGTNVIYDLRGNIIQNMYIDPAREKPFDIITLSLLPYGDGHGVAMFAWYGKSAINEKFIKSLHKLPKRDIPNILVRFLFYNFENIFWSPTWWEDLAEEAQGTLLHLFEYRTFHPAPFYDLRPDGNTYVNWKIVGKRKNNLGLKG